jgi:integration host factor subunit alpha
MSLTKADIIEAVREEMGASKKMAVQVVEALIETIKKSLESGDEVLISGFGKFCVQDKRERLGRNPATEEAMTLPARKVVTFKCSGKLRERINS